MIVFTNKGVIDPRSICCFGVSSKDSPSAIGFFGTGLKYALAILLREGCEILVRSGGHEYRFTTATAKIRNDEFEFVQINGQDMAFTTELGKTWQPWQALRELYCNCMDENGNAFQAEAGEPWPMNCDTTNMTVICVNGTAMTRAWEERSNTILSTKAMIKLPGFEIHAGESQHVFYKGIRAYTLLNKSLYTYNILNKVDLTEDRTIKYVWDINTQALRAFMAVEDVSVLKRILTAPRGYWESNFDFDGEIPGPVFLEVAKRMLMEFEKGMNPSAKKVVRTFALSKMSDVAEAVLDDTDRRRLSSCIEFCQAMGHDVTEYPIHISEFLGENVLGRADDGKIYISKGTFELGSKMLVGTLLEEYWHLKHKVADESRSMQNFLINMIVSMGERMQERVL